MAAYYLTRLRTGADVRTLGSGNAGARNVLRTRGKADAVATLLFDLIKGSIAIIFARLLLPQDWAGPLAFVAVIVGHIWPAQLSFHGGKGAATTLGAMLVIDPRATVLAIAGGVVAGAATRSATVFGLTGIAITPAIYSLLGAPRTSALLVAAACALVLIAHHPAFDRRRQPLVAGAPTPENHT